MTSSEQAAATGERTRTATGLFDADNHYYETRDAFTRFIEPAFRDRAVRPVVGEDGVERIFIGDRLYTYGPVAYDTNVRPGSLRQTLRQIGSGEITGYNDERTLEAMRPEWIDRRARLALMDQQGLDGGMFFPTLAVTVEHFMRDDPALTYANLHAFNRWLDEEWGFAFDNRIFAAPLMSLLDVDCAVAELEWALAAGARAIHLKPGPQGHRSPADPVFDPFWARVDEAGILVICHTSETGYNEMFSWYWSEEPNPACHEQSALQWTNFFGDRPIMDTVSAMILHNLFGRFPNVRVASIENGSLWVAYLLKAMDKMKGMGRSGRWLGGPVHGRPSEIFRQHVWVSPFHEENIPAPLVDAIGAGHVLFGSDYPHAEGLAEPADFADLLGPLDEDSKRLILGGNARVLLGL